MKAQHRRRLGTSLMSIILSLAMIMTGITWPAIQAQAETEENTETGEQKHYLNLDSKHYIFFPTEDTVANAKSGVDPVPVDIEGLSYDKETQKWTMNNLVITSEYFVVMGAERTVKNLTFVLEGDNVIRMVGDPSNGGTALSFSNVNLTLEGEGTLTIEIIDSMTTAEGIHAGKLNNYVDLSIKTGSVSNSVEGIDVRNLYNYGSIYVEVGDSEGDHSYGLYVSDAFENYGTITTIAGNAKKISAGIEEGNSFNSGEVKIYGELTSIGKNAEKSYGMRCFNDTDLGKGKIYCEAGTGTIEAAAIDAVRYITVGSEAEIELKSGFNSGEGYYYALVCDDTKDRPFVCEGIITADGGLRYYRTKNAFSNVDMYGGVIKTDHEWGNWIVPAEGESTFTIRPHHDHAFQVGLGTTNEENDSIVGYCENAYCRYETSKEHPMTLFTLETTKTATIANELTKEEIFQDANLATLKEILDCEVSLADIKMYAVDEHGKVGDALESITESGNYVAELTVDDLTVNITFQAQLQGYMPYGICLTEGQIKRDSNTAEEITVDGLSYDATSGKWHMSNLDYKTISQSALTLPEDTVIVLEGENRLECYENSDFIIGIKAKGNVTFEGTGSLEIVTGTSEVGSIGLEVTGDIRVEESRIVIKAANERALKGNSLSLEDGSIVANRSVEIFNLDAFKLLTVEDGYRVIDEGTLQVDEGKDCMTITGQHVHDEHFAVTSTYHRCDTVIWYCGKKNCTTPYTESEPLSLTLSTDRLGFPGVSTEKSVIFHEMDFSKWNEIVGSDLSVDQIALYALKDGMKTGNAIEEVTEAGYYVAELRINSRTVISTEIEVQFSAVNYGIKLLDNGTVQKMNDKKEELGEITLEGLSYNAKESVWEMNNFRLDTVASVAVLLEGDAKISLEGDNVIVQEGKSLCGIEGEKGIIFQGEGTLSIITGDSDANCYGIRCAESLENDSNLSIITGDATADNAAISAHGIVNGGTIAATGGKAAGGSYGIYVVRESLINTGEIVATAVGSTKSDGYGVYADQKLSNEGTIIAEAGDAYASSYGVWTNAFDNVGELIARAGKASTGFTYGVYLNSGLISNKGTLTAEAGDACENSCGVYSGSFENTGEMNARSGQSSNGYTYGVYAGLGLNNEGSLIAEAGDAYGLSYGVYASSLDNIGDLNAKAGQSSNSYTYGVYTGLGLNNEGSLTAEAGDAYGFSYGVYASSLDNTGDLNAKAGQSSNGDNYGVYAGLELSNKKNITAEAGNACVTSYGVWTPLLENTGDLNAKAGQSSESNTYGIYVGKELSNEKTITAEAGDAYGASYGVYASSLDNTGDLNAKAGQSSNSGNYGVYVGIELINEGTFTAEAGDAYGSSCGVYASTLDNTGDLNAKAGQSSNSNNYGVYAYMGRVSNAGTMIVEAGDTYGFSEGVHSDSIENTGKMSVKSGKSSKSTSYGINVVDLINEGSIMVEGANAYSYSYGLMVINLTNHGEINAKGFEAENGDSYGMFVFDDIANTGTIYAEGGNASSESAGMEVMKTLRNEKQGIITVCGGQAGWLSFGIYNCNEIQNAGSLSVEMLGTENMEIGLEVSEKIHNTGVIKITDTNGTGARYGIAYRNVGISDKIIQAYSTPEVTNSGKITITFGNRKDDDYAMDVKKCLITDGGTIVVNAPIISEYENAFDDIYTKDYSLGKAFLKIEEVERSGWFLPTGVTEMELVEAPVRITTQPEEVTATEGTNATFKIVATGTGLTYKWQYSQNDGKSWINSGAASSVTDTYVLGAKASRNGYLIRCIVKDANGQKVVSEAVKLTVKPAGPVITTQPEAVTATEGTNATFKIAVTGTGLTYKWQYSQNNGSTWINSGAASSVTDTYVLGAKASRNGYLIRCIVKDANGETVTSEAVKMTVKPAGPVITTQPEAVTATEGTNATFKIAVTGTGLTYKWQYSQNNGSTWINSGAASSVTDTYVLGAKASRNGYLIRCTVKDANGETVTSEAVKMTVKPAGPVITTQPEAVTATEGTNATFKVVATGTGLTYQWQYSQDNGTTWKNSSAASSVTASYVLGAKASRNGYLIRCIVKDANGETVTSEAVKMTVKPAGPAITTQPEAVTATEGTNATFKVVATGTGLTYQWQYSQDNGSIWKNSSAASSVTDTYVLGAKASRNGYLIRCIVTDANGQAVTSEAVKMTVKPAGPVINTQPEAVTAVEGKNATFKVAVTGTGLTYQWQYSQDNGSIWKNSSAVSSVTDTYVLGAKASRNGYLIRCVVTDANGQTITSEAVQLTVTK